MKKLLFYVFLIMALPCLSWAASTVTLQWDASPDEAWLSGYRCYWDTAKGAFPKANTMNVGQTVHQCVIPNLPDGTFYFVVTAVGVNGLESVPTPEISTVLNSAKPQPPPNMHILGVEITVKIGGQ